MRLEKLKFVPFLIIGFLGLTGAGFAIASAQQSKRPFTVADDIEVAHFGDPYFEGAAIFRFSPDGSYFAVDTERGRLDLNRVEDSLRFYRSQDVAAFLDRADGKEPPLPVWVVTLSANQGLVITGWRWLEDSSGVTFLERMENNKQRLVLADLQKKKVEALTPATEDVQSFDIRDRQHYVYTVADLAEEKKWQAERLRPVIVGTGRSVYEMVFPDSPLAKSFSASRRNKRNLWAVVGSKPFEVKNDTGLLAYVGELALSPDGHFLAAKLPIAEVSLAWEMLYPPPLYGAYGARIHGGHHNMNEAGAWPAWSYFRIDLQTGSVEPLTEAPISNDAGWWSNGSVSWSRDGKSILLPGTFLKSKENTPSRPCVAVVADVPSNIRTCVERFRENHDEADVEVIMGTQFTDGDKERVKVGFHDGRGLGFRTAEYRRAADNTWQVSGQIEGLVPGMAEFDDANNGTVKIKHNGLEIAVKQGFNDPPLLVGTNKQTSKVLWDPNPQLKNIELVEASVYKWKDKESRDLKGGLYKPSNYKPGQRYPLVIQTHGFEESKFYPSGMFPTAFAARALAAVGIVVLQVGGPPDCSVLTPNEAPCFYSAYQSAGEQLVLDGLADPKRIGIIGFSRTSYYVMELLTSGSSPFEASSTL